MKTLLQSFVIYLASIVNPLAPFRGNNVMTLLVLSFLSSVYLLASDRVDSTIIAFMVIAYLLLMIRAEKGFDRNPPLGLSILGSFLAILYPGLAAFHRAFPYPAAMAFAIFLTITEIIFPQQDIVFHYICLLNPFFLALADAVGDLDDNGPSGEDH